MLDADSRHAADITRPGSSSPTTASSPTFAAERGNVTEQRWRATPRSFRSAVHVPPARRFRGDPLNIAKPVTVEHHHPLDEDLQVRDSLRSIGSRAGLRRCRGGAKLCIALGGRPSRVPWRET